ncbi:MAG: hypothetical protein OEZ01_14830 [Candidatus Heimdallarchaeota archaeon]|nr:hypothetical protein [Candidatus Heimdallarchaeota archaeon]MDH5647284.1 hypothetical protein [Candidatus Heimdallarchaeota archaeon]
MEYNVLTLYPTIFGIISNAISLIGLLFVYKKRKFKELATLSIGLLFYSIHPMTYLIFEFLKGDIYIHLRQSVGVISAVMIIIGLFIMWISINNLSGFNFGMRQFILFGFTFFSIGLLIISQKWSYTHNNWNVNYVPNWTIIFIGLCSLWLCVELVNESLSTLRTVPKNNKKRITYVMVSIGWSFNCLGSIVLIFERIFLGGYTTFYIAIGGIGTIFLMFGIVQYPYSIVPRTVQLKQILIISKSSGIPIIEHSMESENKSDISDTGILIASAMTGILAILKEITLQNDIPREFKYLNLTIMIEESANYVGFLIAAYSSNPVRSQLRRTLIRIEDNINPESIHNKNHPIINNINQNLDQYFEFAAVEKN